MCMQKTANCSLNNSNGVIERQPNDYELQMNIVQLQQLLPSRLFGSYKQSGIWRAHAHAGVNVSL